MQNQNPHHKNRWLVSILIIIIVILAIIGFYAHYKQNRTPQPTAVPPAPAKSSSNETLLPSPKTINAFTLTDDDGKPFTNQNLKGRWSLVFFGFTHCGDVCPTTLTELNKMTTQLQQNLPAGQLPPQVVFISVDPQRDTTPVLHNYIKNFNPSFIAASGDETNLNVFVKDLGVYFAKTAGQDANNYGMNHSSQLFLFNPNGNWAGILTYPFQSEQLAKTIGDLYAQQQT